MKKIAVILSGSGVFDGAEIHESVLALHAVEKAGATWHCFAPNVEQLHVVNHLTGEATEESRNVLVEAARIARGNIEDVAKLNVDGLMLCLYWWLWGCQKPNRLCYQRCRVLNQR